MVTDHSRGLEVASGLDRDGLRLQRRRIEQWNGRHGDDHQVFQGLEVEIRSDGTLDVPKLLRDCEYVNVPTMKTHGQTMVTLGVKNQKGLLPMGQKKFFHKKDLHACILALSEAVRPDLTVVDGIYCVEGRDERVGLAPAGVEDLRELVEETFAARGASLEGYPWFTIGVDDTSEATAANGSVTTAAGGTAAPATQATAAPSTAPPTTSAGGGTQAPTTPPPATAAPTTPAPTTAPPTTAAPTTAAPTTAAPTTAPPTSQGS